jgi:hypothetical protein
MAILRNEVRNQYTVIHQNIIRDDRLSLKALGLLVRLLSLPDNWNFSENGLIQIFKKDGQASIRTGLKELEQYGYLRRNKIRNAKGQIAEVEWIITENPQQPQCENPQLDFPSVDTPSLDFRPQSNTNISNTNVFNTNQSINSDHIQKNDMIDTIDNYTKIVENNIDYDVLITQLDKKQLDEIVYIIVETLTSTKKNFIIAGETIPAPKVKQKLKNLMFCWKRK